MYKITSLILATVVFIGYIVLQKMQIDRLEIKNSNLKKELKVCKSSVDSKDFELKWADEFSKIYDLNASDIEDTGVEVEKNSTQNDSDISFSDTF